MDSFCFHHARIDGVHTDLLRSQLFGEDVGYRLHGALGGRINCRSRRVHVGYGGADIDDAAAIGIEKLRSFLRRQNEPQHVGVEMPVKMLLGDLS